MESYVTDMHWLPASTRQQAAGNDIFAVACTDGTVKVMNKSARIEKSVPKETRDGHTGAVTALRWNYEGTALATAGEDGSVKVWSKEGLLRSNLSQAAARVYSLSWGSDADRLVYASGKVLSIRSMQPGSRPTDWKAHDATILKVDWNPINGLIASAGEDRRFKIWDSYGRLLFQSPEMEYAVTCVSWSPSGDLLAVGTYNTITLCDRSGWTHCKHRIQSGSVINIAWTQDGTQCACAGGNGAVVFCQVVGEALEAGRTRVTLEGPRRLLVEDLSAGGTSEEIDLRDPVVKLSIGFGFLVVATTSQGLIYNTTTWGTPVAFDLRENVTLIRQAERCFLIVDTFSGIQVMSYEGRRLSNPKFQGLQTEFLRRQSISLSSDVLAVIDRKEGNKVIRFFDANSGKELPDTVSHDVDIASVQLSHAGPGQIARRLCAFIDRNGDLFLSTVVKPQPAKLAAVVDSIRWHDKTDMLIALSDQKMVVWYYPHAMFVDKELALLTRFSREAAELGKDPLALVFTGTRCLVRRSDGAVICTSVPSYPLALYQLAGQGQWSKALRLCRFANDRALWASLAVMAIENKALTSAEYALAALDEVDKLQFVVSIKDIPTQEGRDAALALFRRKPEEAEETLLQAGLIYRAIDMNMGLMKWDRALELAVQHKTHLDTVLYRRMRWLQSLGLQEDTDPSFLQYKNVVQLEESMVLAKVSQEVAKEAERPGARRYTDPAEH